MKIDEASINHNALRLIANMVSTTWEMTDERQKDLALGYIVGVTELAGELKEVLNA